MDDYLSAFHVIDSRDVICHVPRVAGFDGARNRVSLVVRYAEDHECRRLGIRTYSNATVMQWRFKGRLIDPVEFVAGESDDCDFAHDGKRIYLISRNARLG